MKRFFAVTRAFLIRDAVIAVSYRLQFFFQFVLVVFTVFILYFVSQLIANNPALESYGGYLPFAAIGLAMSSYFQTGFSSFATAIRNEQTMGTLEALLMTPTRIPTIVIASSVWDFFWATMVAVTYLLTAEFLLGITLRGSLVVAMIPLLLTTLIFASLGVISASFVMVFKRGDPIGLVMGSLSTLLGGVFYPVSALPQWLQGIAQFLPITYGLEAMRQVLLKGATLRAILPDLLTLMGFAVILIPVSLVCFKKAVRQAKREGSLLQY